MRDLCFSSKHNFIPYNIFLFPISAQVHPHRRGLSPQLLVHQTHHGGDRTTSNYKSNDNRMQNYNYLVQNRS